MTKRSLSKRDLPPSISHEWLALCDRLVQRRKALGQSQQLIAERLGVSVDTIGRLERGDHAVSVGVLLHYLWVLGLIGDIASISVKPIGVRSKMPPLDDGFGD